MSSVDWAKDRRRRQQQAEGSRQKYLEAQLGWAGVRRLEQERYREIAERYAARNQYCRELARQLRAGGTISRRQAAVLLKIDHEQR